MKTMPILQFDPVFNLVEESGRVDNLSSSERAVYERDLKAYRDYHNTLFTANEEGLYEGRAEGRAEGIDEGRSSIVKAMIANGITADHVARLTGISLSEINNLSSL